MLSNRGSGTIGVVQLVPRSCLPRFRIDVDPEIRRTGAIRRKPEPKLNHLHRRTLSHLGRISGRPYQEYPFATETALTSSHQDLVAGWDRGWLSACSSKWAVSPKPSVVTLKRYSHGCWLDEYKASKFPVLPHSTRGLGTSINRRRLPHFLSPRHRRLRMIYACPRFSLKLKSAILPTPTPSAIPPSVWTS